MKKRLFSALLVFCFLFQFAVPVSWAEEEPGTEKPGITEFEHTSKPESSSADNSRVNIEVILRNEFPVAMSAENASNMFTVTLTPKAPETAEQSLVEGEETHIDLSGMDLKDGKGISFTKEDVEPGQYTLKMSAEYYYRDIMQDVTIKQNEKLTLEFSNRYDSYRGEGKASPGIFPLGDVNGAGIIDQSDVDSILAKMGQTKTVTEIVPGESADDDPVIVETPSDYDPVYDLNRDGKTNLVDLCIMAVNFGYSWNHPATPQYSLMPSAVTVEEVQEKAKIPEGHDRPLSTIMEEQAEPLAVAPEKNEPISEDNPVEIELSFPTAPTLEGLVINAPANPENAPAKGAVKVDILTATGETDEMGNPIYEDKGDYIEVPFDDGSNASTPAAQSSGLIASVANYLMPVAYAADITTSGAKATIGRDGSISIDLGDQVAVKTVTIVVARAKKTDGTLTEIAKVEFLNDMESRIPEPEITVPDNIKISGGVNGLSVSWSAQKNVTGYEVELQGKNSVGGAQYNGSQKYTVAPNRAFINEYKSVNGGVGNGVYRDKIAPEHIYRVRVRAINDSWSGPWSDWTADYEVKSMEAPHKVDGFSVNPKYKQLNLSWQATVGTRFYTVEYKLSADTEWTIAFDKEYRTSYSITGLADGRNYDVRICGWNYDPTKYDEKESEAWNKANAARSGPYADGTAKTTSETPVFNRFNIVPREDIEDVNLRSSVDPTRYDAGYGADEEYPDGLFAGITDWRNVPAAVSKKVAWSMVDGDYSTYFASISYADIGLTTRFKNTETITEIIATSSLEDKFYTNSHNHYRTIISYKDPETNTWKSVGSSVTSVGSTAKNTLRFTLSEPITTDEIAFGLHKYYNEYCVYSEVSYVRYSPLEGNVYALYNDDMHVELNETAVKKDENLNAETKDVSVAYINELRAELAAAKTDFTNGDEVITYAHPSLNVLQSELDFAELLLTNSEALKNNAPVKVNPEITKASDGDIVFSAGTSGYQPLGYVAAASGTQKDAYINVYAGQKGKKPGEAIDARLVFTQYFAEASGWKSGEYTLVQGMNEIKVPKIASLNAEWGGSMYAVHTSNNLAANPVEIRVTGATKIPVLDLHRPVGTQRLNINEAQWKEQIGAYLTELESYVSNIEAVHNVHQPLLNEGDSDNATKYGYKVQTCFLNSTEIGLDNVLMSIPATQVWDCLKGSNVAEKTESMYSTLVAMNQMMEMLYKQRGLNPGVATGNSRTPKSRFNARYHRMIAGAAGYAGGLHLGLGWGTVGGTLMNGEPIQVTDDGKDKYVSGSLFGWLVAHEMGHNADGGGVVYQEITNNIWSQFVTSYDNPNNTRPNYQNVYKHVTTSVAGKGTPSGGNQATALAMYWQLHLAYDNHYTFYDYYANRNADGSKILNEDGTVSRSFDQTHYDDLFYHEFFARYYSFRRNMWSDPCYNGTRRDYMRKLGISEAEIEEVKDNFMNSDTAEKTGEGVSLPGMRWGATTDQNIMRTACTAAGRDLTEFFEAWGMTIDNSTKNYAKQFPKENRKIQYINDNAFHYQMNGGAKMSSNEHTPVDVIMNQGKGVDSNKVEFTFSLKNEQHPESILGYELIRNGKTIAFITAKNGDGATTSYTDVIASQSNRVMSYEVVAYDKYLSHTAATKMEDIKVRNAGELPKEGWYITGTNLVSDAGVLHVEEGTQMVVGKEYEDIVTGETMTYAANMDVYYMGDSDAPVSIDYGAKVMFDGDEWTAYNGTATSGAPYVDICLGGAYDITGMAMPNCTTAAGSCVEKGHAAHATHPWSFELWFKTENKSLEKLGSAISTNEMEDGRKILFCKPNNASNNIKGYTNTTHIRLRVTNGNKLGFAEFDLLTPSGDNVDIGISTTTDGSYSESWSTDSAIGILDKDYVLDAANNKVIPKGSIVVFGSYKGNPAYNVVSVFDTNDQYFAAKTTIFAPAVSFTDTGMIDEVESGTWIAYLEPLRDLNEKGGVRYGVRGDTAEEDVEWFNSIDDLPETIYAELYRVDDAVTMQGQRMVSDSFRVKIPKELKTISLSNTIGGDNTGNESGNEE